MATTTTVGWWWFVALFGRGGGGLVGWGGVAWGFGGEFFNDHLSLQQPAAKEDLQRVAKKIFD